MSTDSAMEGVTRELERKRESLEAELGELRGKEKRLEDELGRVKAALQALDPSRKTSRAGRGGVTQDEVLGAVEKVATEGGEGLSEEELKRRVKAKLKEKGRLLTGFGIQWPKALKRSSLKAKALGSES